MAGKGLRVGAVGTIPIRVGTSIGDSEVGDVHMAGPATVDAVDIRHPQLLLQSPRPVVLNLEVWIEAVDNRPLFEGAFESHERIRGLQQLDLILDPLAIRCQLGQQSFVIVASLGQRGQRGLRGVVLRLGHFDLAS